jgi:hypothetical protein
VSFGPAFGNVVEASGDGSLRQQVGLNFNF